MTSPRSYSAPAQVSQPPYLHADYKSTIAREPNRALTKLPQTLSEVTGPRFDTSWFGPENADMTRWEKGEAQGQRIILAGRVLDEDGRPVPKTLLEVWQCNAAGRYRFVTVKPGAYPWLNHPNAWRPAHIHFSLFGPAFATRLVTQMYFPGDPLFDHDPIFQSVRDPLARQRLVSSFDLEATEPEWALAYRFDIVLRGRDATPMEA